MNLNELVDRIAGNHSMEKKQAKQVIEAVFAEVVESAKNGEEVSIPGFGKFKIAARDARQGRNPATGEAIQIAASKKLAFTPAKQVKDALNVQAEPEAPAKGKGKAPAKTKAKK